MRRLCHYYHDPRTFKAIVSAVVGGEYQDYMPSFHSKPITVIFLTRYHVLSPYLCVVTPCSHLQNLLCPKCSNSIFDCAFYQS